MKVINDVPPNVKEELMKTVIYMEVKSVEIPTKDRTCGG